MSCLRLIFYFVCWAALAKAGSLKVATYNISFNSRQYPDLRADLEKGEAAKMHQVAAVIRKVRPDVILLAEFDITQNGDGDVDDEEMALKINAFRKNYLEQENGDTPPINYGYSLWRGTNTGVPSGLDLNANGKLAEPADAWGYGEKNGQFGFVLLSRFPIQTKGVRSFRKFRWSEMPENLLPRDFYGEKSAKLLRLSSKTHLDVPVKVDGRIVHFLLSHPTPPGFDGDEDRNGRRNFDEIRLWADYLTEGRANYLSDDQGRAGGLGDDAAFVILGDLNADPLDGISRTSKGMRAIDQLLMHPRVLAEPIPVSEGAAEQVEGRGMPEAKTASFKLRVDYVLPSKAHFEIVDNGVFWPAKAEPDYQLIDASDHRMVWAKLKFKDDDRD